MIINQVEQKNDRHGHSFNYRCSKCMQCAHLCADVHPNEWMNEWRSFCKATAIVIQQQQNRVIKVVTTQELNRFFFWKLKFELVRQCERAVIIDFDLWRGWQSRCLCAMRASYRLKWNNECSCNCWKIEISLQPFFDGIHI